MKNVLKRMEGDDTQFFVMKSFIYTVFEYDRKKPEYHIYFIKSNSSPEAYEEGFMNLKVRRMNKMEKAYFLENVSNYENVLKNEDGTIYNFNTKPFDRSQCPKCKQMKINL